MYIFSEKGDFYPNLQFFFQNLLKVLEKYSSKLKKTSLVKLNQTYIILVNFLHCGLFRW